MNVIDPPEAGRRSRRILPRWAGAIFCGVSMPLVHGGVPWAISLLSIRHGWVDGHPGTWNWAGLGLVALGCAGIVWALSVHFAQAPQGWEFEPTPNYLLTRGPYRFTRNPIYVAYALIWPGWVIFYGSVALVMTGLLVGPVGYLLVIPREERNLEARFGEAYREYKRAVPRWLGRIRLRNRANSAQ